jgi:hypothetical protein
MTTLKRAIPLQLQPAPELPETITIGEVAKRLGRSPNTIRRWIDLDMQDGMHRVPGARRGDTESIVILRAVFERAMRDGEEPAPRPIAVASGVREAIAELRDMAARCTLLADQLRDAQVLERSATGELQRTG